MTHQREALPEESLIDLSAPILEARELYERAMTGDADAFTRLVDEELNGVRRLLRRELRRHGIEDGPAQDELSRDLLGQAMSTAQTDLSHKPSKMSVAGWLGLKVRRAVEEHFRPPTAGGMAGAA